MIREKVTTQRTTVASGLMTKLAQTGCSRYEHAVALVNLYICVSDLVQCDLT